MTEDFNRDAEDSVQRQLLKNPDMARLFWENQKRYAGDAKAMEDWARDGFISNPEREHDIRDEGLI